VFELKEILNRYHGGRAETAAGGRGNAGSFGGIAGGAIAGGLMDLLTGTKTGRKFGKNA